MIRSIDSKDATAEANGTFEAAFSPYIEDSYHKDIGYQSGSANRRVFWMPTLNLWAHFGFPPSEKGPPTRYWNVFGIGMHSGTLSIVCEINPPVEAKKYPPAGVLARDDNDSLVILHRGKLTVTGGIKLAFVKRHLRVDWVSFIDRGKGNEAILVAKIPSNQFGSQIRDFVLEIHRVKELARDQNLRSA